MPPKDLGEVLSQLPTFADPNVLVGLSTADDGAVYKLDDQRALVSSIDVFTPIVDDPYQFGQIAAANSLSDIYAMGGRPLFALGFIGFPLKTLPLSVMTEILKGGVDKAAEAGIGVIGGHSVDDPEPKYGLCVIGEVHPDKILTNAGAKPGDTLFLTKAVGTGVISQGIKKGTVDASVAETAAVSMASLNRAAGEALATVTINACTDITGFGFLGHLHELAHASGVTVTTSASQLPLLPGALELAEAGVVPGGSRRNLEHFGQWTTFADGISDAMRILVADAQTSGGLLVSVSADHVDAVKTALQERGVLCAQVGSVAAGEAGKIIVEA